MVPKRLITMDRNKRSRCSEMGDHDGAKRAGGDIIGADPAQAGVMDPSIEVAFWGTDAGEKELRQIKMRQHVVRSLSLADAMSPHTLLCYEMNGATLPPEHGFPLRLTVPGWYGIANVKWLMRIEVLPTRWEGRFMARDYVTIRELIASTKDAPGHLIPLRSSGSAPAWASAIRASASQRPAGALAAPADVEHRGVDAGGTAPAHRCGQAIQAYRQRHRRDLKVAHGRQNTVPPAQRAGAREARLPGLEYQDGVEVTTTQGGGRVRPAFTPLDDISQPRHTHWAHRKSSSGVGKWEAACRRNRPPRTPSPLSAAASEEISDGGRHILDLGLPHRGVARQ
jgi:DMSO/TMAO reductase YedYZ molybdopterin-dependent catalytic subunit